MENQLPIISKLEQEKNGASLLQEHHLVGLFYYFYHDSPLSPNGVIQYKKQWIHNQTILSEIELIDKLAKNYDIKGTILKGAHLLLNIYSDLGSRFLSDIDFLILGSDLLKWSSLLSELGYTPILDKTFHGNHFKNEWTKVIGEIEINIELHTKLFFHLKHEGWQFENTSFSNITKLKDEDFFIHLCGHLAFQHNFLKLFWLFDIYFYNQKYSHQMDWHYIRLKSITNDLYSSVQICLWTIQKYFDAKLEKNITNLFEINNKKWWKKILTIDFLINPHKKRIHYFLLKHATKDRLASALYYDLTWFFHYKIQKPWSK